MKTILISIFCVLFSSNFFGQDQREKKAIASTKILKEQLKRSVSDSARFRLTTELSTEYNNASKFDSCKKYAQIAINFSKKFNSKKQNSSNQKKFKKFQAKALQNFGVALSYDNVAPALVILNESLQIWKEIGDKNGIAMTYYSLAIAYGNKSNSVEALNYFNKSLELFKETKNEFYITNTLYNISLEKRYLGLYGDALEYSFKSLKAAEKIKDTFLITDALLGNSFNYMLVKKYDEAHAEQEKALKLFKLTKDNYGIARTYNDMAVTYQFADRLNDALKYHKKALELRKKLGDPNAISISYNYIALIYRTMGKPKQALEAVKEGIPYALKFGNNMFLMDAYMETGDIYMDLKEFKEAISYYNLTLNVAKKNNSEKYQAMSLMQIGAAENSRGNTKKAIEFLKKAAQIVSKNDYAVRQNIYMQLTSIYVQNKDYKNGYENQINYHIMRDSVQATEKAEKIAALTQNLIYENKRALQEASQGKEIALQQAQIAKQKLVRNLSIVGSLVGIILAIVFFVRLKEKRKLNIALQKSVVDLKTTQSQLVQSEKMASLGELTAGIAHEIQNPLNFVNNFSEVSGELLAEMQEEIKKGNFSEANELVSDVVENLKKIKHHGKRADAIVKGMLQHSRKSSGKKEPTDLNQICDEYLRLSYHGLRAQDKTFNATIFSEFDDSIGEINLLPQDFGRVVLNLLTNAFYAVNEKKQSILNEKGKNNGYKPTVSITTKKENDAIIISIIDNGNGMPKEIIDKIFQPFFTTKPSGKGTGLGLSMSFDIITKSHNGELKVESTENEGTKFKIILPI